MTITIDIQDTLSSDELPDASVGVAGAADPLEALSWQMLRGEIYGEPAARPRTDRP
jgi:hypothetical protein